MSSINPSSDPETPHTRQKLSQARNKIDEIDNKIVPLLCQRAGLVTEIAKIKQGERSPIYRPEREKEVYKKIELALKSCDTPAGIRLDSLKHIYREVMSASLELEGPLTVHYLGPQASFSHFAVNAHFGSSVNTQVHDSIPDVFHAVMHALVAKQNTTYGLVPIDNSTEGSVKTTLDSLLKFDVEIYGESYISVHHHLLYHEKLSSPDALRSIKKLYTIGIAKRQCRRWLRQNLSPELEVVRTASTAAAAQAAAQNKDGLAIASELAAELYGLDIVQKNIHDNPYNQTRFLTIGTQSCTATQDDKTSIVFSLTDSPGSLARLLNYFKKENINLTKIESHPNRIHLNEYYFFIDFLASAQSPKVSKILKKIKQKSIFLKVLGSYPRIESNTT